MRKGSRAKTIASSIDNINRLPILQLQKPGGKDANKRAGSLNLTFHSGYPGARQRNLTLHGG